MDKEKSLINRIPEEHKELVQSCLLFVREQHQDDFRLSGENYLEHAIDVAQLVLDTGLDINSVLVSLLHHVYFTPQKKLASAETIDHIKREYGEEVLELLEFVNHLSNITKLDTEREILTKFILKDCDDLRALIIRLCDKIMNARTIESLPREKQLSYSEKLLRIYAPLSEYLNLYHFKKEFEEIAFKTGDKEEYEKIDKYLTENKLNNKKLLTSISSTLEVEVGSKIPDTSVFGRIKGHYSIYKKQKKYIAEGKGRDLSKIKDVIAFSILVEEVEDCYIVLGYLQNDPKVQIVEIEDYILDKKPNGYSAIHLQVEIESQALDDIVETEIQILTYEMYHLNTYGSASHFAYKQQGLRYARPSSNFEWVKDLRESLSSSNSEQEIVLSRPIESNIFVDQVYVFTPKREIVALPNGATIVDFAFTIHTDVGNRMIGAKVNDNTVSLGHVLSDGDLVEIVTSNNPNSRSKVSDTWLEYATTNRAKRKIIKELTRKWK